MDERHEDSVNPAQESGASTEKDQLNLNSPIEKYKKDMLRYKDEWRNASEKLKSYEEELSSYRLEKEKEKGNYSQVIDELKEKARNLETQLKQKDVSYARTNIESAIAKEAMKRGCKDTDVFLKLVGDNSFDIVSLDSSYRPDMRDIETIVEDNMKKYEGIGLFGRRVNVVDASPNNNPVNQVKKQESRPLTSDEILEKLKNLDGVKRIK